MKGQHVHGWAQGSTWQRIPKEGDESKHSPKGRGGARKVRAAQTGGRGPYTKHEGW